MICIGYHMRGEVISVLSLEGRYHILSLERGTISYFVTSERSERGTKYDMGAEKSLKRKILGAPKLFP